MKLSSIIDTSLVFLDLSFSSYEQVITFIVRVVSESTGIAEARIRDSLQKREEIGSTILGNQLALPHGYVDSLDSLVIVFIRLSHALTVTSALGGPTTIRYVFAILASVKNPQLYLKTLAAIADLVANHAHLLNQVNSAQELISGIDRSDIRVKEDLTAASLITLHVSVAVDATVANAVDIMRRSDVMFLPVENPDGTLTGVIELADLLSGIFPQEAFGAEDVSLLYDMDTANSLVFEPLRTFWENEAHVHVRDIMRPYDTYVISDLASYTDVMLQMARYGHRFLVAVSGNNRIRGVIDTTILLQKAIRP